MLVCLTLPVATLAARGPEPVVRLPLEAMGYQQLQTGAMLEGASMLTVHFVDESHLLVTFGVRRLMPREEDDPPDDVDHVIGARLVEIPSGRVIASTEWRMHDQGQYLWALGHGRFLLRIRDHLSVIAPMRAAMPENAFEETPFLKLERHIVGIVVSADDDLLTLETVEKVKPGQATVYTGPNPAPVQVNFYRLSSTGPDGSMLQVAAAGVVRAKAAFVLPITTGGFLDVAAGGRDKWLFNFDTHGGKVNELAEWDTTCFPHVTFVSHSEFVAFGCRGSTEKQEIGSFNLRGEQGWQQSFYDTHVSTSFGFAPGSGRFALGRIVAGANVDLSSLSPSGVTSEEVRVYQTYSGKLLFKMDCSPVERTGQNFALSADGMKVAVVRETAVFHPANHDQEAYTVRAASLEVYALPELTEKDRAAVKEAQGLAPETADAMIRLSSQPANAPANVPVVVSAAVAALPAAPDPQPDPQTAASLGMDAAEPKASAAASGDAYPATPRPPPTLYAPGETPPADSKPK